jgi:hypothetical protein
VSYFSEQITFDQKLAEKKLGELPEIDLSSYSMEPTDYLQAEVSYLVLLITINSTRYFFCDDLSAL